MSSCLSLSFSFFPFVFILCGMKMWGNVRNGGLPDIITRQKAIACSQAEGTRENAKI